MNYDALLRDGCGLAGVGLVGYGAWSHYPPLGFMAAGILLIALAVAATLRPRSS